MAQPTALSKHAVKLKAALIDAAWGEAANARASIVELFVNAMAVQDADVIEAAGGVFSDASLLVVLAQDLEMREGPEALAWQLRGDAQTAAMARQRSSKRSVQSDREVGTARDNILVALLRSNTRRMSNQEILREVKATTETVSRALGWLRSEGFVDHWKVGRMAVNQLTAAGVERAQRLLNARAPIDVSMIPDREKMRQNAKQLIERLQAPARPAAPAAERLECAGV